MKVAVIIPAAGRGERFGAPSKLDQDVGGRPLLMRTVELFSKRDEVQTVIVAGPPDDLDEFKARYGAALSFHGAVVVAGGMAARWETVRNALGAVPDDCTHVAVHDAARPAAGAALLDRLFEAARTAAAVVPAVAVTATVKRVEEEKVDLSGGDDDAVADAILGGAGRRTIHGAKVIETVDRRGLMEVQTPQVFEAALLRRAYEGDPQGATDDASLVERLGEPVYAVEGERTNIKVTTPADLKLLRAVLGVRPPAERAAHKRF